MRLKRKRYDFPREKGIYAFRTKKSDLQEFASVYRMEYERGRTDNIAAGIYAYETMVNASDDGWSPCSSYWYTEKAKLDANYARWSKEFVIMEDICAWTRTTILKAKRVARLMMEYKERFRNEYILIYWETERMSKEDIITKAQMLMEERCKKPSMPLYNYALYETDWGQWRLYARKAWLRTFDEGKMLINIYNIMKPNFKNVFGFNP